MQFEEKPRDDYEHGLVLEYLDDEVETVAAAYRELIFIKASRGNIDEIEPYERNFSMWSNEPNHTILTNYPLKIAGILEEFHERTEVEVRRITRREYAPMFESDSIARRMYLGDKALEMAGVIRLKFDSEGIRQELDSYLADVSAEADTPSAPEHPIE